MKRFSVLGLGLILVGFTHQQTSQKAVDLVEWSSVKSQKRFSDSKYKSDFFTLSNHFISQENGIECALASSAIVLNALFLHSSKRDSLPRDETSISKKERANIPASYYPFFKKFTQNNVLNSKTKTRLEVFGEKKKINGEMKRDVGVQLRQLAQVLSSNGASVKVRVVDEKLKSESIKREIKNNLKNPNDFVLINYARKALGQKGGGHVSPVGAYDQNSDSFLVMDVNSHKAPWVWVQSKDLIRAMRTFDTVENRGYLLISSK